MINENLAENVFFLFDVIVNDVGEPCIETLDAALILTRYSWNNEIQKNYIKKDDCEKELKKLENQNPHLWAGLFGNDAETLIKILTNRKMVFHSDDKRLVADCFINIVGTLSVVEDDEEKTLHVQRRF